MELSVPTSDRNDIDLWFRLKSAWRRFCRSPFITDLRLIKPEYRSLYRGRMKTAGCGEALAILADAYCAGHFRRQ
jgi:hypothetical protein